jgi:hypothetical protein
VTGLAEAVHFADAHGLEPRQFAEVLNAGPMSSEVSRSKLDKLARRDLDAHTSISNVLEAFYDRQRRSPPGPCARRAGWAARAEEIDTHLEALRRKDMVEPEGTYWVDEPVYRFHHVLIRDAAYRSLLKEARAELHERFADWLAASSARWITG